MNSDRTQGPLHMNSTHSSFLLGFSFFFMRFGTYIFLIVRLSSYEYCRINGHGSMFNFIMQYITSILYSYSRISTFKILNRNVDIGLTSESSFRMDIDNYASFRLIIIVLMSEASQVSKQSTWSFFRMDIDNHI